VASWAAALCRHGQRPVCPANGCASGPAHVNV
jgi:hypothetical protein